VALLGIDSPSVSKNLKLNMHPADLTNAELAIIAASGWTDKLMCNGQDSPGYIPAFLISSAIGFWNAPHEKPISIRTSYLQLFDFFGQFPVWQVIAPEGETFPPFFNYLPPLRDKSLLTKV
jgi:hypothetical protein